MPNPVFYGFEPAYTVSGGEVISKKVQAKSNPGTGIFTGDPVAWDGANWYLATAGTANAVDSICLGAEYRKSDGKITREPYLPAATTYTEADGEDGVSWIYIVQNVADVVFRASVDEAIVEAGKNLNYNFVVTQAGSTVTGRSGAQLDATAAAVTATLQFRMVGFAEGNPRYDRTLTNALVYCMINTALTLPSLSLTGS